MPPSRAFLDNIRNHIATALADGTLRSGLTRGLGLSWTVPIAGYALYAAFQAGDPAQIGAFVASIGAGLIGDTLRDWVTRRHEPSLDEITATLEAALADLPEPGPAPVDNAAVLAALNDQLGLLETVLSTLDEAQIGELLTAAELEAQLKLFGTTIEASFAHLRAEQQQGFAEQAAHLDRHTQHVDARFDAQAQSLAALAARLDRLAAAFPQLAAFDQRGQQVGTQVNIAHAAIAHATIHYHALAQPAPAQPAQPPVPPGSRDILARLLAAPSPDPFFAGDYGVLRGGYIDPRTEFERVDLAHFTGREWLVQQVDDFLTQHDRGYFLLRAEAGLGKTTFLAWLARERGYPHHLCRLGRGEDVARRNLAAQLALVYGLPPQAVRANESAANYLDTLLATVAGERQPDERVVLVVDGLDEADTPGQGNVLGLPARLPEGVYLLVSQRPVPVRLSVERPQTPLVPFDLAAESPANRDDMRRFLTVAAAWPGVGEALAASDYTAQQFIDTLLEKCRGVWIYLHYVVEEIRLGARSPLALETLPDGMADYYAEFWQRWRQAPPGSKAPVDPDWRTVYLPFLAALAASREPCPLARLLAWAGLASERAGDLRDLCAEQWRPFLAITGPAETGLGEAGQAGPGMAEAARYRFYHATLQEFFAGQLAGEALPHHKRLVAEVAAATRTAHGHIADHYLALWGGLAASLPGLRQPAKRDADDGYGLRHLAAHLEAAGRVAELHHLLRVEWVDAALGDAEAEPMRRNAWFVAKEAAGETDGYLGDVQRAWGLAEREVTARLQAGLSEVDAALGELVGLQCRYALIQATINTLIANMPVELLVALVKYGRWLPQQALTYVRQRSNRAERVAAMLQLQAYLPVTQRDAVLDEALRTAQSIEHSYERASTQAAVAEHLAQAGRLDDALHTAQGIEDSYERAYALAYTAAHLSDESQAQALDEALLVAQDINNCGQRARALADLAAHLTGEAQARILDDAQHAIRGIEQSYDWERVLATVATRLAKAGRLDEALHTVEAIQNSYDRVHTLSTVALQLSGKAQIEMLDKALLGAQAIEESYDRERVMAAMAAPLAKAGRLEEALRTAKGIQNSYDRAYALTKVAAHLSGKAQIEILEEALLFAQIIANRHDRERVLADVTVQMAEGGRLERALNTAQRIERRSSRVSALVGVAAHMAGEKQIQTLEEALRTAQGIQDSYDRAQALAVAAAHQAKAGLPVEAMRTVKNIDGSDRRERTLVVVAAHLAISGRLEEALRIAKDIEGLYCRASALVAVATHMTGEAQVQAFDEVLRAAQHIEGADAREGILADLASRMAESGRLDEALHIVEGIENIYARDRALADVAVHLANAGQLDEALRTAYGIEYNDFLARTLATVATRLAEAGRLEEALATAQNIEFPFYRALALVDTVAHMTGQAQVQTLDEALRTAQNIEDPDGRAHTLAFVAVHLAKAGRLDEALCATQVIESNYRRAYALAHAAAYIAGEAQARTLDEALNAAQSFENNHGQTHALATVASRMAESGRLDEALQITREFEGSTDRATALAGVAAHLPELRPAYLHALWLPTLHRLATRTRADLLSDLAALAPVIHRLGGEAALTATADAIIDVGRWWP